ncbi:hypothetical protein JQS43_03510 [Natronosporangium hydrolyticum]|uniref:DUF1795 domain-containing protein n=1 Tax=Natronosporangium hydrolyticum TaxID=2811111 RepID=A0A895YND2_9ACTN|nr:hypothetical protein [Natronosporangium hydrolyticum]QSB15438.1 hypothetical protein JQS43_03510 [Natronosporangium hydrolyticum]
MHAAKAEEMVQYKHPRAGFSVPVPREWERAVDTAEVPLIVAAPPDPPWRFRANLIVTVDQLGPEVTVAARHAANIEGLHRALTRFRLLDQEESRLRGCPLLRTLGHHAAEAGAVTFEQWIYIGEEHCFALTASVGTLEYPAYREIFAAMVYEFRLPQEVS